MCAWCREAVEKAGILEVELAGAKEEIAELEQEFGSRVKGLEEELKTAQDQIDPVKVRHRSALVHVAALYSLVYVADHLTLSPGAFRTPRPTRPCLKLTPRKWTVFERRWGARPQFLSDS